MMICAIQVENSGKNRLSFFCSIGTLEGHQFQMQNSNKLFKSEKLMFIKKQKYPRITNLLTFGNQ